MYIIRTLLYTSLWSKCFSCCYGWCWCCGCCSKMSVVVNHNAINVYCNKQQTHKCQNNAVLLRCIVSVLLQTQQKSKWICLLNDLNTNVYIFSLSRNSSHGLTPFSLENSIQSIRTIFAQRKQSEVGILIGSVSVVEPSFFSHVNLPLAKSKGFPFIKSIVTLTKVQSTGQKKSPDLF